MLYRSVGRQLIVERQFGDGDVLDRTSEGLQEQGVLPNQIARKRSLRPPWRLTLTVDYPLQREAAAAESWIEREIDI
ncbi:MAG TPA: hypothetical protein VMS08_01685 [Candidatus Saccharimonadia bacterium]|nr:hypothetical protein [Candidatus Saccharimonadia bacterium]